MNAKNTADEVKEALYKANGLIRLAAVALSVSPQALRGRINRNKELQEALAEAREGLVDRAEESLYTCLQNNEPWAVALVLKTIGKSRGYVERQELTGANGGAIVIDWGADGNSES